MLGYMGQSGNAQDSGGVLIFGLKLGLENPNGDARYRNSRMCWDAHVYGDFKWGSRS